MLIEKHVMFSEPHRQYYRKQRMIDCSGLEKDLVVNIDCMTLFETKLYLLRRCQQLQLCEVCVKQTPVSVHFRRDSMKSTTVVCVIVRLYYTCTYCILFYKIRIIHLRKNGVR